VIEQCMLQIAVLGLFEHPPRGKIHPKEGQVDELQLLLVLQARKIRKERRRKEF